MRIMMKVVVLAMVIFGMSLTANAAVDCPTMTITLISADAANGGNLWLRNDSGAACGALANGAQQYYVFNPKEVDKLLAVGLTAVSLGKQVWVRFEGDASVGSVVSILSMRNQ